MIENIEVKILNYLKKSEINFRIVNNIKNTNLIVLSENNQEIINYLTDEYDEFIEEILIENYSDEDYIKQIKKTSSNNSILDYVIDYNSLEIDENIIYELTENYVSSGIKTYNDIFTKYNKLDKNNLYLAIESIINLNDYQTIYIDLGNNITDIVIEICKMTHKNIINDKVLNSILFDNKGKI